ncbi:MAG: hypothetical protein U9N39_00955 [Campylobacterota bacterium]|nr:hypothetical protein [Campylobacterota bacterium]
MRGLQDDISDIELKQRWRLYWIHTIFEFSSIELQKSSWLQGESSFYESTSAYFEILALDDAYEKAVKYGNVSKEEAQAAQTFHTLLVFYDEPSEDPQTVLEDPEWMEVVETAKEFWSKLKMMISSQKEIELIEKLEKEFS